MSNPGEPPPHPPIIRALTEPPPTWAVFCDCTNVFDGAPVLVKKKDADFEKTGTKLPPIFRRIMTWTVMELVVAGYPHTAMWQWVSGKMMEIPDALKQKLMNFFVLERDEGALQVAGNCINCVGYTTEDPGDILLERIAYWTDRCDEHRKKVEEKVATAHKAKILVPSKAIVGAQGEILQ